MIKSNQNNNPKCLFIDNGYQRRKKILLLTIAIGN